MKLKNRVVIITGAASGIGKAIALLFAKEGAKVVACDISKEVVDVVKTIKKGGGEAISVMCNVSKSSDVKRLIEQALKKYGRINILVNNAGVYKIAAIEDLHEEDWDNIFNINLKGPFLCCKEVLPVMKRSKKGVIINISSDLGLYPEPESPAYCATKAGLISLTKSLALAYTRHNIRINAICPGSIDTPLLRKAFSSPKKLKQYVKNTVIGRLGRPEEVANVALFLASDDSSYVSGATYTANAADIV